MKTYNLQPTTYNRENKSRVQKLIILVVCCLLFVVSFVNAASVYEGTNVPYIHPRSEWLNTPELQNLFFWYPYTSGSKPANEIQDYYPVSRIVIHDSGCNASRPGCNDDTVDPVTQIQNIFRFHSVTRIWGDIGYHYIIDHKGDVWEGRYGGNGVRGAHVYNNATCQNFNVSSIGIELLGNYYDAPVPPVMMDSLEQLVGWLAYTNNIDIQNQSLTTPVWTNAKNTADKCDPDISAFTTSFTGPTVLTHRQLEENNSDIKSMDFATLWNKSYAYLGDIKTYAFQEQGNNTIYDFAQAKLQALASNTKKLVTLIKSQLDIFRPELFAKVWEPLTTTSISIAQPQFPDGSLLKAKGKEEVYLVKNQQRIHISSAALFEGLGLNWSDIKEIEENTINALAMGQPIVFPDGILLQAGTPDVYYVKDSKRYLISSTDLFVTYKFNWSDLIRLTLPELDRYYPWGGYVKWPDGSVLKNSFNPAQIVMVQNNTAQPLTNGAPKNKPVYLVNGREIASYQSAQVLAPSVTLALAQAFSAVKEKIGLGSGLAVASSESNVLGSDTPLTPTTATVPPAPPITPPPPPAGGPVPTTPPPPPTPPTAGTLPPAILTLTTEPTIKIDLCKTRSVAGDLNKCAFASGDVLNITTDAQGITTVDGFYDPPGFNTNLNDNRFRGKVYTTQTADEKIWLINELPLENYLKGVSETASTDKPEYRKALITIARSYAYYYLTQEKKYPGMPFDLNNLSYSQVYRGYNYELRSNGLPAVVDDSHGTIVTFNGKPIVGAYSSDSSGVSKSACPKVFPRYCNTDGTIKPEFAYLKGGVVDPPNTPHNASKIAASHGVGMCAIGARTMVDLGKTASEVIKYYYSDVDIQKIY